MVGGDQLIGPVVWLASVDNLLAVICPVGKLIGPVHPVYPGVNVVLVAAADLEDSSNPAVV